MAGAAARMHEDWMNCLRFCGVMVRLAMFAACGRKSFVGRLLASKTITVLILKCSALLEEKSLLSSVLWCRCSEQSNALP